LPTVHWPGNSSVRDLDPKQNRCRNTSTAGDFHTHCLIPKLLEYLLDDSCRNSTPYLTYRTTDWTYLGRAILQIVALPKLAQEPPFGESARVILIAVAHFVEESDFVRL